jgi:hypothetical protein
MGGHLDFNAGNILGGPSEPPENQQVVQERLRNLGKKNEGKSVLPDRPGDCLGDPLYLQNFSHHETPEEMGDEFTEELAAAGARPGEDLMG